MNILQKLSAAAFLLSSMAVPAFAGTTIYSPSDGASVPSTFTISMTADSCAGRPVTFVGYSFDNNPQGAGWHDHQINGPVGADPGWHKLHVKVWNDWGGICVTDLSINVGGGSAPAPAAAPAPGGGSDAMSRVPSYAQAVSSIQNLGSWGETHDGGTPGWSSGWTGTQGWPSLTGSAREFATTMNNFGGHRYAAQFGDDTTAHNFMYDTWLYVDGDTSAFKNLEFDLNQTMQNGQTALMGFQCDGWTGTWDYTINGGSPENPWDTWQHSGAHCNPQEWGANQWHHIQIQMSREDNGWVTYQTVWLDGVQQDLYVHVFSGFALGWGPALVTNFQVDGSTWGTTGVNIYLDNMTVYRW